MRKLVMATAMICFILGGVLFFPVQSGNFPRTIRYLPVFLLIFGVTCLMCGLLAWRLLGKSRADTLFANITISGLIIVVMLVLSEFALRLIFREVTTTTSGGGYLDRSWYASVRINQWGFREKEYDLEKREGVYRIAVIGDSITFGQGVGEQNRFTNLLEKRLNDSVGNFEVLNFGRPGAETIDHINFLNARVMQSDPDFILLQWYTNDVEGHDKSERPSPLTVVPIEIREYSIFLDLLQDLLNILQERLSFVDTYDDYMRERFGDPESASSQSAERALREFVDICRENQIPLSIILYSNNRSLDFLVERVLKFCEEKEITCLDLRRTFVPYQDNPSLLWASRVDSHPGPLAHSLIAEAIFDSFGDEWISLSVGSDSENPP